MKPERKEEIQRIPKRLRDYEQYVDACDDAADAIEELLAALDEVIAAAETHAASHALDGSDCDELAEALDHYNRVLE